MHKTFCDRCGKEATKFVHVDVDKFEGIYAFKHFCPECLRLFVAHLDEFIPDFLPKPPPLRPVPIWKKWLFE